MKTSEPGRRTKPIPRSSSSAAKVFPEPSVKLTRSGSRETWAVAEVVERFDPSVRLFHRDIDRVPVFFGYSLGGVAWGAAVRESSDPKEVRGERGYLDRRGVGLQADCPIAVIRKLRRAYRLVGSAGLGRVLESLRQGLILLLDRIGSSTRAVILFQLFALHRSVKTASPVGVGGSCEVS